MTIKFDDGSTAESISVNGANFGVEKEINKVVPISAAPMTPLEKRKQLASVFMTLALAEFPQLEVAMSGIDRQLMESFVQATLIQYGNYINDVLGIKRD